MAIPNHRLLRRRQLFDTRVFLQIIDGLLWVESARDSLFVEGISWVAFVGSDEEGPTKESRFSGLVEFVKTQRQELLVDVLQVPTIVISRTVFAPIKMARSLIDRDPKWIATAHDIDLRTGVWHARWKEVARRNGITPVLSGTHPQNLSVQDRAVRRGPCRIQVLSVILIVAATDIQIPLGTKSQGARFMNAVLIPERGNLQNDLLARLIQQTVFVAKP